MKNPSRPKKRKLISRLQNEYRLVIMNEGTFEEKLAFTLTPMNVFIVLSIVIVLFTLLISSLVIFTPLKEYIPGYADESTRRIAKSMVLKVDSLEREIEMRDEYINNYILKLKDSLSADDTLRDMPADDSLSAVLEPGSNPSDSLLRAEYESEQNYSLWPDQSRALKEEIAGLAFFTPLNGYISQKYDRNSDHYAIDIVARKDDAVKAALPGTVIIASWTPETGHVIGLQHSNNLVTIYKHNSVLLKKVGTFVNSGDAIAVVGNSGELTTGQHLHFEMWYKGSSLNPEEYLVF